MAQSLAAPLPRAERSFASVAEEHLDDVFGYLLYVTGDRTLAEDLTGETFERALRRWRRFDPRRGSARTWLCQLARSAALDHFRAERRRKRREEVAGARTGTSPRRCSAKGCRRSSRRRCGGCRRASAR